MSILKNHCGGTYEDPSRGNIHDHLGRPSLSGGGGEYDGMKPNGEWMTKRNRQLSGLRLEPDYIRIAMHINTYAASFYRKPQTEFVYVDDNKILMVGRDMKDRNGKDFKDNADKFIFHKITQPAATDMFAVESVRYPGHYMDISHVKKNNQNIVKVSPVAKLPTRRSSNPEADWMIFRGWGRWPLGFQSMRWGNRWLGKGDDNNLVGLYNESSKPNHQVMRWDLLYDLELLKKKHGWLQYKQPFALF